MVKRMLIIAVILTAIPAMVWAAKTSGAKSGTMSVQVKEVQVRTSPNYLGSSAGTVTYGTEVNVISEEGNWFQIDRPSGWLPKSALTKHKVAMNPDQKFSKGDVKRDEVALAGKGFNPQVEAEFKKNNASYASAFVNVDRIENFGATEAELKGFQSAGKLQPR